MVLEFKNPETQEVILRLEKEIVTEANVNEYYNGIIQHIEYIPDIYIDGNKIEVVTEEE